MHVALYKKLILRAMEAREIAYAPYSGFRVGAALLTESNRIFTGCNIENVSFGATCCAERVAIFKAVSHKDEVIKEIAIVSDSKSLIFPCGICRQVMVEFKIPKIIVGDCKGRYKEFTLEELMPYAFEIMDLDEEEGNNNERKV